MNRLRLALISPITHPLPPPGYGPWEQVVWDLAEALVDAGHEVTVFGPPVPTARFQVVATVPAPLTRMEGPSDGRVWEELHIAEAAAVVAGSDFDVVHNHLHVHALGYSPFLGCPMVTTLHGVAWNEAVHPALARWRHLPFVSISEAERAFYPDLDYVATVPNGIDTERFPLGGGSGGYLLFVGRLAPEKAPHLAIATARRARTKLILAGVVEEIHRPYFEAEVRPHLGGEAVDYLGPVSREELAGLYGEALALVMPLTWDEPFGLVAAEAMTCGTPVIGWRRGSLPELIDPGVTGILVGSVEEAAAAVAQVGSLDRGVCRQRALARFDRAVMAACYVDVYQRLSAHGGLMAPSRSSRSTETADTPRSAKP